MRRVRCEHFSSFLKTKVDKRREDSELVRIVAEMDLDGDGFINENDLSTCLGHIQHNSFFGDICRQAAGSSVAAQRLKSPPRKMLFPTEKLGEEKAIEVARIIRNDLTNRRMTVRDGNSHK